MIKANMWLKVAYDDVGERRIRNAIETMEEIDNDVRSVSPYDGYTEPLRNAIDLLSRILDGELY